MEFEVKVVVRLEMIDDVVEWFVWEGVWVEVGDILCVFDVGIWDVWIFEVKVGFVQVELDYFVVMQFVNKGFIVQICVVVIQV